MANSTPAAEITIDEPLVRRLLKDQAPELAALRLKVLAAGWDNTLLRLGDTFLVRLPHREASIALVRHEQEWLPKLAPLLPVVVPVPVVLGRSSADFPWPWSVVEYVEGDDAINAPPEPAAAVDLMVDFFAAMHRPAPPDAPVNPFRGGPLNERDAVTMQRFDDLDAWLVDRVGANDLRARWRDSLEAEAHQGPPMWIHGDVHPGNVIVREQQIVSVIDFGDLTSGDPATDLGSAWMFFDQAHRDRLRERLGVDPATWRRARGWALSVSLAIAQSSADNPRYGAMAAQTLARVASDQA